MSRLSSVRSFLGAVLLRKRTDRDLERELTFHVDERARDLMSGGLSRTDATRRALEELGDAERWRVEAREARGLRVVDELAIDVRIAFRAVVRSPAHSLAVIAVIAVGMTATTHMAAELNAAFWRTLPVRAPESLRMLTWSSPRPGFLNTAAFPGPDVDGRPTYSSFSYPVYAAIRDEVGVFSDLACWMDPGETLPVVMGDLGIGAVHFVSGNAFSSLGIRPALGRVLVPEDDTESGGQPAAVLSERFWRLRFLGNPAVLDSRLTLNGTSFRIVGVTEPGFFGLDPSRMPDVMVPMGMLHIASIGGPGVLQAQSNWSVCRIVGRLRGGISDDEAREAAEAVMLRSMMSTPNWPPRGRVYDWPKMAIVPIDRGLDGLRASAARPMLVVSGVVAVLFLVAVANVAGLLLARGIAREREVATRLALGASRSRLWRQFLGEALMLGAAAGAIAFLLVYLASYWTPSLLAQLAPTFAASRRELGVSVTPDLRVLCVSLVLTIVTALLFGSLPALRAGRVSLAQATRGPTTSGGSGGTRAGHVFVALQAALAMVLLIGAALFVRTVANLQASDLGFKTDRLLYVRFEPRGGGIRIGSDGLSPADAQRRRATLFQNVVTELARAPGIVAASASVTPPLADYRGAGASDEPNAACTKYGSQSANAPTTFVQQLVAPGFFRTLQLPLVRGRDFEWSDQVLGRQRVAIVSEAFVRRFFPPDVDPLGERVGLGNDCPTNPTRTTIIGVVADSRLQPRSDAVPLLYQMYAVPSGPLTVILRTDGEPAAVIPGIRRAMAEFDSRLPLFGETSVQQLLSDEIREERLVRALLLVFAGIALLLNCFGVYAAMSYGVQRRTAEIGVRLAIGARGRQVTRMLVTESLTPVALGLLGGTALSFVLARSLESLLFGLPGPDLVTIAGAGLALLGIAALGCLRPVRHACRIDPVSALRAS